MRGWGAIVCLAGVVLLLALVATPGRGDHAAQLPPQSLDMRAAGGRVLAAGTAARAAAAVRGRALGRRVAAPEPAEEEGARDRVGSAIERQRSAMRAAVMLLVAAEAAPPDAR